uniref:DNA_LIGASE_A3 domain-containing protein n=1 Tax=Echinostoma caproni TaxID=27848 RepID=A0A183B0C1_9TREM
LKQGTLTPRLHEAFRVGEVQDCILDAEIMAYNTWTDTLVPKTAGFDVKRSKSAESSISDWFGEDEAGTYQPCVVVFDVIYLNGKSLTTTPLLERKRLLREHLFVNRDSNTEINKNESDEFDFLPEPVLDGTIYLSSWNLVPIKVDQVTKIFNRSIDSRQEGLVAKLTVGASPYLPGRRLHGGWWKLKPDYVDGLLIDLDCLVVGGCYMSVLGRKTKRIGHFICAVRDDRVQAAEQTELSDSIPTFLSFCRASYHSYIAVVNNGLTTNQLKEINQKLRPHWKPYDRKHPNTGPTEWLRVTTERPDVWIAPQNSITFQIHASEMTPSASYATGLTLRFPRIVAVREDKSWQDCLTLKELQQLNSETEGKMAVNRLPVHGSDVDSEGEPELDKEGWESSSGKNSNSTNDSSALDRDSLVSVIDSAGDLFLDRPGATSTPTKKRKIKENDRISWRTSSVAIYDQSYSDSGFLSGKEFCLILPVGTNKLELESRICAVGGIVVQNAGPDTFCIVTDKITAKVSLLTGLFFRFVIRWMM